MCGRLACTLSPDSICKACSLKDTKGKEYYAPEWVNSNDQWSYRPSHNVAPTDVTPVLVSGKHFPGLASDVEKAVVHPMIWGMIPPWHKGAYNNHKMSTNNCRLENVLESRLYSVPLYKGQRCVVICDGFYEWQTTKGSQKQPYFIYAPQVEGVRIENKSTWDESWSEETGWHGPQLLKLAALFDIWNWLNFGNLPAKAALELLQPTKQLIWHPVDTLVNNSRNKDPRCNNPKESKPKSASSSLMESWLKRSRVKQEDSGSNDGDVNSPCLDQFPSKRKKED
ncbi:abasic site processing protein HMCES isoform X2 [Ischnura elegans]|uniref:abasic site processing protein HMCES isoform X2 n=1 Tax=Ischnura elegans TaxID=197161 RepID=UPI001ED89B6C|nr:abasic site processing protein HMCES isoform X2 [Ischnura elegans]